MSQGRAIALWVGAVSAGKTFASLIAFLIAIRSVPAGERIVIMGRTLKTIEGNVIDLLKDRKRFGILSRSVIHTPGASFAIILGRRVELIGAPNERSVGAIQGGTIALAYVDEATLMPRPVWDMLVTRMRVPGAQILATTNPESTNHWLRKEYMLKAEAWDMVVFHLTMRDNPSLERAYVLRMVRGAVGVFFQRFILGLWTNAAGAIYEAWDPDRHVVPWAELPPIQDVIAVGIDHGTSNATSCILLGITDETDARGRPAPRLALIDEWRHDTNKADPETGIMPPRLTNVEQSALIRKWLASPDRIPEQNQGWGMRVRPGMVFVDPAAADFREQLGRDRLPNVPAENAVKPGIADLSSLMALGRLIVSDRCTGFLEEVTEYVWDPKATKEGEDEPLKVADHSMDAARYAVRSSRAVWTVAFRRAYGLAA